VKKASFSFTKGLGWVCLGHGVVTVLVKVVGSRQE